ncbi:hypothetical protein [Paenibacillus sp. FSL E2-0178]
MSLHDPIGTDKEGNEIMLIDILGYDAKDLGISRSYVSMRLVYG